MELAELQDKEVGDGTTSVVIVAAELLKVTVAICSWVQLSLWVVLVICYFRVMSCLISDLIIAFAEGK